MNDNISHYSFTNPYRIYNKEILWHIDKLLQGINEIVKNEIEITSFCFYFTKKDEIGLRSPAWCDFWEVRKPKPINFYIEVISELKWDENSKKDSLEKLFFAIHDKPYWKDEAQLKKIVTSIREDANWIYNIYVGVTLNV